jgi:predicted nucleotidyltransferase component of viral defense system
MMPTYNKLALGKKAQELGFARDSFEKMSRLTEVLKYLSTNNELRPLLALKGGTAINLTMFNLPRLSVDIDFDFAKNLSRTETMSSRNMISEVLGRYMRNEGYLLKDKSKHSHALDSFVYSYTNAAGNFDNMKIEINYIMRSHLLPLTDSKTQTAGVFDDFTIMTLSPLEIFSSKIVALSDRAAARDLYDLYKAISAGVFDESSLAQLRKYATFYLAVTGDINVQKFDFSKLDKITENVIHTDLRQMMRATERFDLQNAKRLTSEFLSKNFVLNENETSFLKQFSSGKYKPDLLFDNDEIIRRIEKHPMALWRQQRIRDEYRK